jgi:hypothetical protein
MGNDGGKVGRSTSRGGIAMGAGGLEGVRGKLNIGRRTLTGGPHGAQRQGIARRTRNVLARVGGPRAARNGYVSWNRTRFGNPSLITTGTYRAGTGNAGRNEARRLTSRAAREQYRDSKVTVGNARVIGRTADGRNIWGFSVRARQ